MTDSVSNEFADKLLLLLLEYGRHKRECPKDGGGGEMRACACGFYRRVQIEVIGLTPETRYGYVDEIRGDERKWRS